MKHIDRLLLKATGGGKRWSLIGFVEECSEGKGYRAHWSFWDGRPGRGGQYPGELCCTTIEEAQAAIEQALEAFEHRIAWASVLVDDYGSKDEGDGGPWRLLGFISRRDTGFEASWSFWPSVAGYGRTHEGSSYHPTREEAREAILQAGEGFPHELAQDKIEICDFSREFGGGSHGETA